MALRAAKVDEDALRTATGKESTMALRAAKAEEAVLPGPVPERK